MSEEKKYKFKYAENVKIRLSDDGRFIKHILPNEKVVTSISVKYYQKMLASLPNTSTPSEQTTSTDEK